MKAPGANPLDRALLLRTVEESLLRLFAEGKVAGTTHTCIGQEMSAIALADSLDRTRDIVFSNHRCHGHYLAWTDDVEGLIAEVMGKRTGVCGGIGGSQHLCAPGFFSNGIQGGIVPVSAGLAMAAKFRADGGIVAVCIGDGTLGEGVVYETFNIASKWRLPLLILLENNLYAQSTSQTETMAGEIEARAAAFGIPTHRGDTWDHAALGPLVKRAADAVRETGSPVFVRVDTYRLAAHSKGDDDRDPADIARYASRDPVNVRIAGGDELTLAKLSQVRARVEKAIATAHEEAPLEKYGEAPVPAPAREPAEVAPESGTQLEAINRALGEWLSGDPKVVLLGEDIRSPYGGAFKVTRGLSFAHPDRVLNTPISEAAIVGVGNGLALGGMRPVVEVMFGDFLGLCFDQILNHAAKFRGMYNRQVENPIVIRTPMGGGRGYGPTHSQNIEKHFAGIPGIRLVVPHARTRIGAMYRRLRELREPVLIIENKLLYRERCDAPLPPGCALLESGAQFPDTIVRPGSAPDLTIVAFGRMSVLAEAAAARLLEEEEIVAELVFPLQLSPFVPDAVIESVARTGKLLVVEEGAAGYDLGAEVIATSAVACPPEVRARFRRIAARPAPIPSALPLEQLVLPDAERIVKACLELFDE
jgi:2-oxoisovalerate dehydrogenase E1 component